MVIMKILIQTDEDCKECDGTGMITEIKYKESGSQWEDHCECRKCLGTGKKLEWMEASLIGNSLYIDGFF